MLNGEPITTSPELGLQVSDAVLQIFGIVPPLIPRLRKLRPSQEHRNALPDLLGVRLASHSPFQDVETAGNRTPNVPANSSRSALLSI